MDSDPGDPQVTDTTAVRRRPAPVTLLAILQLLLATLYLAVAIVILVDPGLADNLGDLIDRSAFAIVEGRPLAFLFALVGSLQLLSAILLLRLQQTGWTLAMLLAGISLGVQIVQYYLHGNVTTFALLLQVVSVLYLNQRTVREAFRLVPVGKTALEDERG